MIECLLGCRCAAGQLDEHLLQVDKAQHHHGVQVTKLLLRSPLQTGLQMTLVKRMRTRTPAMQTHSLLQLHYQQVLAASMFVPPMQRAVQYG